LRELGAEMERARAGEAALAERLAALESRLDLAAGAARGVGAADLDAAVARWMERRGADAGAGTGAAGGAAAKESASAAALSLEDAVAQVLATGQDELARAELWKTVREAGLLEDVIAELERRAAADPGNAGLQVALGEAYLQPIFAGEQGPMAGVWATKADQAYDRALAIDPGHWHARFNKAVSLSFWPPVLGKQGEAIRQFEVLLEQQQASPLRPEHLQTYLFLGNLYEQTGDAARALEVRRQGLALFPDSAELQRLLGAAPR
jgi:hypothetical protein